MLRRFTRPLTLLSTVAVSVGLLLGGAATPAAAVNFGTTLEGNETMQSRGDMLAGTLSGHSVRLIMQSDNNLVLYKNWAGHGGTQVACGASNTTQYADTHAYMSLASGTFSVYDSGGTVRWTTYPYTYDWGWHVRIGYDTGVHQAYAAVYSISDLQSFRFWHC